MTAAMPDAPAVDLCTCEKFVWWYTDDNGPPIDVCRCGHPAGQHLDGHGTCVGEVVMV